MNEPITRRRRKTRQTDSLNIDTPATVSTKTSMPSPAESTSKNDNTPDSISQVAVEPETNYQITIDCIRSELQDSEYYYELDDPEYSDNSHDWSDNYDSISSDYWHFLGRYE